MKSLLNRSEILRVLRENEDLLRERFYVKKIGVFGSFARDEGHEKSDIDFLVELDAPLHIYISNRYALQDYLQNLFQRNIDLANPHSLKPFYKEIILKQAIYA